MSNFQEAMSEAKARLAKEGDSPVSSLPTEKDFSSILRNSSFELRRGRVLQALKLLAVGMVNLVRRK